MIPEAEAMKVISPRPFASSRASRPASRARHDGDSGRNASPRAVRQLADVCVLRATDDVDETVQPAAEETTDLREEALDAAPIGDVPAADRVVAAFVGDVFAFVFSTSTQTRGAPFAASAWQVCRPIPWPAPRIT